MESGKLSQEHGCGEYIQVRGRGSAGEVARQNEPQEALANKYPPNYMWRHRQ